MRLAARPDFIVRRLEAAPQHIGLRARHVGRKPPLLLQVSDLPGDLFGIVEGAQRLHPGAELLLHGEVREAAPLVGLAELLHFGHKGRLRRL